MPINKPDLNMDLNYRQLADRHDFDELHAMHDEYLRLIDHGMRVNRISAEVERLRRTADVYQQAIDYKEAEGQK